jgi:hypothetical protein
MVASGRSSAHRRDGVGDPSIILSGQGVAVHEPPDSRYELLTHRMLHGK